MNDGASLILNGTGLTGMDKTTAVKQFYKKYPTNGILDAYIYNEKGVNTYPKNVKLTSYLHEVEGDNNGYFYIAISVLESKSIDIDITKTITVEYTVVNDDEVSGYGIDEIKIAPEVCDHYSVPSETSMAEAASYKPVIKAYNYEDEAKNVNLYVATYNDRELESLIHVPLTLNSNDSDIMVLPDSFVAPSAGKKTKVFVWDADNKTPLEIHAEAITAVVE